MSKRDGYESSDTQEMETLPVAATTAAAAAPAPVARKGDEEKVSLFWRLFGGAVISVAALGGFTLYNTLTSNIAELRTENSRLKEDAAAYRTRADDNRREIDAMKERLNKYRTEMDAAKKDVTVVEKDLQKALAEVREKVARMEGQQSPMKLTEK